MQPTDLGLSSIFKTFFVVNQDLVGILKNSTVFYRLKSGQDWPQNYLFKLNVGSEIREDMAGEVFKRVTSQ